jgi:hypothetical protein
MKSVAVLALAGDRDGGVFPSAHVTRQCPAGTSAHGLPCMASRLRQRGAVLRETLPTPPFTSLRGTPHHPDQVMVLHCDGCTAEAYPAKDGGYPSPVSKGGGPAHFSARGTWTETDARRPWRPPTYAEPRTTTEQSLTCAWRYQCKSSAWKAAPRFAKAAMESNVWTRCSPAPLNRGSGSSVSSVPRAK